MSYWKKVVANKGSVVLIFDGLPCVRVLNVVGTHELIAKLPPCTRVVKKLNEWVVNASHDSFINAHRVSIEKNYSESDKQVHEQVNNRSHQRVYNDSPAEFLALPDSDIGRAAVGARGKL